MIQLQSGQRNQLVQHVHDRGRRGEARVFGALVRIQTENLVIAAFAECVAVFAFIVGRNGKIFAAAVFNRQIVRRDIQAVNGRAFIGGTVQPRLGLRFQRLNGQRRSLRDEVFVLVEEHERAAIVPERPVGEHRYVDRHAVLEQDVIGGRSPALGLQRVLVVDVVHQVFIVAPEILHVHRFGAAGDIKRGKREIVEIPAVHIAHADVLAIQTHVQIALAAFAVVQALIVFFQHVQIQVQHRRTLDDLIADVLAALLEARGRIAIEILQTIIRQIEIRHRDLDVRKHRAVASHEGNAVAGKREVNGLRLCIVSARRQRRAGTCRKQQREHQQNQQAPFHFYPPLFSERMQARTHWISIASTLPSPFTSARRRISSESSAHSDCIAISYTSCASHRSTAPD